VYTVILNYFPPQFNGVKGRGNDIQSQGLIARHQIKTVSQHSAISSGALSGTTTVAVPQSLPATTTIAGRGESVSSPEGPILSERTNGQCPRRGTSPSKLCM
jgi:hypothetical protein